MQEAQLVVDRLNAQTATDATLLQMAISTVPNMSVKPSATKQITKMFGAQIKALLGGT
jgi:hypothetical protein